MASLIILAVIIAAASASKHAQSKSEKSGKLSLSARTNKSIYDLGPVEYNVDANMYSDSLHPPRYSEDAASKPEYSLPAYNQIANYHPAEFEVLIPEDITAVRDSKLTPTPKRVTLRQKLGHWRSRSSIHVQSL